MTCAHVIKDVGQNGNSNYFTLYLQPFHQHVGVVLVQETQCNPSGDAALGCQLPSRPVSHHSDSKGSSPEQQPQLRTAFAKRLDDDKLHGSTCSPGSYDNMLQQILPIKGMLLHGVSILHNTQHRCSVKASMSEYQDFCMTCQL